MIEHIAGVVRPNSNASVYDIAELVTNSSVDQFGVRNDFPMTMISRAGSSNIANTWGFNQPVIAYVEAGQHAMVTMSASVSGAAFFAQATISGYLVDLTQ